MNQFYDHVETLINETSTEALNTIINKLNENPGPASKDYGCGDNVFYIIKRLCGAALARDNKIKENASNALKEVRSRVENVSSINKPAFVEFFLTTTDMSDCKSKQQKNSYIQGKISIIKAFEDFFKGNQKIVTHFLALISEKQTPQEELLEVLHSLVGPKISGLKLNLVSEKATLLLKVLTLKPISQSEISTMLNLAIEEYPKDSITLKFLGLNLQNFLSSPQQFFKSNLSGFINATEQQTEDGDLKKLYYLLMIQKYFLSHINITSTNISKFLCIEMIIAWLQQLRVKNKHMRKLANSIEINFDSDADFSFEVLKFLHEKKMYLENISVNHPFAQLYKNVDANKFWSYLVELINKENSKEQMTGEEDQELNRSRKEEFLSELEFIARQRGDVLTPDQVGETLTVLIKAYQASKKSQKLLNLVWSLFHSLLAKAQNKKTKKKIILNTKGSLMLSKIKLHQLQVESQIQEIILKSIKFLRLKIKAHKQSQNKIIISFLNFVTGLLIYCIVYPEEADVCAQIEFIFKDLEALLAKQEGLQTEQDVLKKKIKKSQEVEDPKKPIHVLVDVFISLLTKAPIFLRTSINLLFEQMVPLIETSDLDTLLDVIQKPDQQYIEEI